MVVLVAAAALNAAGAHFLVAAVVLAAAAYVDATIVMPMFMDEPEGDPSLGSWDVTFAEEGSPMKWAYGANNRIPGQLIMAGFPWSTQSGGGGGKRAEPVQYTFWTDIIFALCANEHYRIDRIDIEGNTGYIRDTSTTLITSFQLSIQTFKYKTTEAETLVVWQRTGPPGSTYEWSLIQWHITIENQLPYEMPSLASFLPGEMLKATTADPSNQIPSPNGNGYRLIPVGYSRTLGSTSYPLLRRSTAVWNELSCVSSRNHGNVQTTNNIGDTVTVPISRLVIDVLGTYGQRGLLDDNLLFVNSAGTTSFYGGKFYQGVSTAERDAFDPNGRDNPFNYGAGSLAWPRPTGSVNSITFEYATPRNWALDVMKTVNPVQYVDWMEHHGGAQTYIDPIYSQQVGSTEVPALPQLGYISIANLNLSRFGNRIPQMHFYIDASKRKYVGSQVISLKLAATENGDPDQYQGALETLLVRHGNMTTDEFDVASRIAEGSAIQLQGMHFGGLHDMSTLISAVCMVADLYPQEWGGKIHFFERSQRPVVKAAWHMLDARQWNSPPGDMLELTDEDIRKQPKRVHLKFMDIDKDMQTGDVYAYRDATNARWTQVPTGDTNEVQTRRVKVPHIVMTSSQARPLAERMLSDMHNLRQRVRLRLPSWYQNICEGDAIALSDYEITAGHRGQSNPYAGATKYQNRDWWIIVDQVDIGADFFVEIEGAVTAGDPTLFQLEPGTAAAGGGYGESARQRDHEPKGKLGYVPPSILVAVDIPPLLDAHAGKTGIYLAYCSPGALRDQPSGSLKEDVGDGDNWLDIGPANKPSIMGRTVNALADGPVNIQTSGTDLVVELLSLDQASGALSSTTDLGLARGANLAAVGHPGNWEIIQFKTATEESGAAYMSDGRWRLTDLRRGLRGSERFTGTHEVGQWFVLLDHRNIHFHEFDNQLVGLARRYRVEHATEGSSGDTMVTVQGYSSLPLPVESLIAWRKSNGDIVFTWKRRTRARYRTLGTQPAPLMEATESYDVVIDLGTDRTINVTDAKTATYTAAMQSSDSTSGAEITATVYQRDSVRGRGQPSVVVVAQTQAEVGTQDGNVLGTEDGHTLNTPLGGGMD